MATARVVNLHMLLSPPSALRLKLDKLHLRRVLRKAVAQGLIASEMRMPAVITAARQKDRNPSCPAPTPQYTCDVTNPTSRPLTSRKDPASLAEAARQHDVLGIGCARFLAGHQYHGKKRQTAPLAPF